ncbi:unnamed protein product [Alopecurus aequalis]
MRTPITIPTIINTSTLVLILPRPSCPCTADVSAGDRDTRRGGEEPHTAKEYILGEGDEKAEEREQRAATGADRVLRRAFQRPGNLLPRVQPCNPSPPASRPCFSAPGSSKVVQRNFVVKAASGGEGPAETPEIVKAAQDAWAKVEDKYAVATIGVAGLVALWTAVGALKAIDKLPILPGVLELVGIGYTGWFTYRNLIFQPDREALISNIKSTYNEITGSSS